MEHGHSTPTYHHVLRVRPLALRDFAIANLLLLHELDHDASRERGSVVVGALRLLHAVLALLGGERVDGLQHYRGRRGVLRRGERYDIEPATEQHELVDESADLARLDLVRGLPVVVLDSPGVASAGFEQNFDDLGGLGEMQRRVVLAVRRARGAGDGGEGFDHGRHLEGRRGGGGGDGGVRLSRQG